MDVCAKLESFLTEEEINSVSESVQSKIIDYLSGLNTRVEELQNETAEVNAISERQQFQFEKEISSIQQQFQESSESCIKLKAQISEIEDNLCNVQKQWRDLQKEHDNFMLEFQSTKRSNELLIQEKKDLTEQLEKRRGEINKLNGEFKSLLDQVEQANQAKYEAIAGSEEAKMKESNLQHQVNRFEQEKVLLTRQIEDLNAEISQQSHQIHTLNREKSHTVLELQTQLEQTVDELHLAQKQVTCLKESNDSKDLKIEALAAKIREINQSRSKSEEQFTLELNAQSKLADLYKKGSEDNQKRVSELVRAFEETQKLLTESNNACEEMEKHCENVENECKLQLEQKLKELIQLKEELRKLKEASRGLSQENLEIMFPTAAATSKVLHSGMTLTEMYAELVKAQDELQRQKNENADLNQQMRQILLEIEEKTPLINQRMQEYQKSLETNSCLKNQLATAYCDFEKAQNERNDAKRISGMMERENERLKLQVKDLNHQVQVLLREVEDARRGFVRQSGIRYEDEAEVSSSDNAMVTASSVISRHLVTFRDIEELQKKNQHLLAVVRDLSLQQEEMEKKISEEQAKSYASEIEKTVKELNDLKNFRSKQDELMDTIIRQRDMYKVLLTNQGFSDSFLGQSPSALHKSPAKRDDAFSPGSDSRLNEAKSAMQQIQVEFNNYKKEKTENERLLNVQLDKSRSEVSELRIENAKLSSQCEYSEERVGILKCNVENFKKECLCLREKNKKHTSLITQHQQTINTLRQDMLIAQEKLSKSQVSLENVKAERDLLKGIESRLLHEKESVQREQHQQSRVMANLQAVQNNLERIESETKRNLQHQVDKFEKENAILKTKLENSSEEYRSAVKIWEKQNKELQQKVDVEVERNRKTHEDLVDAYSQVHALNQELLNVKAYGQTSTEKGSEISLKSTPDKSSVAAQNAAEIKAMKEKLNEANVKLKALQDKLDLTQKSAEQYSNMCKDLELRVKEQDRINKHLQESISSSLSSSSEKLSSAEKKLETMEKHNRELIEENMKVSQSLSTQGQDLQKKITELQNQIDGYKSQAETAVKTSEQARGDCQSQLTLMQETQEKYERELMLHAEAVHLLTELKEKHQHCTSEIERLGEIARSAQHALEENKESLEEREKILAHECKSLRNRLSELEKCNSNLHDQLELMGTQMKALQSKNWEGVPLPSLEAGMKDTQKLLEVIQFIKTEKEIISTQYDAAISESVRLNLKIDHLTNELNEAKLELKEFQSGSEAKASSDMQHSELLRKIEMMNLLTESNNLLRMEKESLSVAKEKLESQLHELEVKIRPLNDSNKRLSSELDTSRTENEALRIEVKSWQSRTNQLLEQSHRIGPQEYKNLMREIEELKSQKARLAEELQRKQAELSQHASHLAASNKDQEKLRGDLREKVLEASKLSEDNGELQKTVLQIKKIGRKYKTQYDELKVSYESFLAKSQAADSAKQEQSMQEFQKRFDDVEKNNKALQEQVEKHKEIVVQAKKEAEIVEAKANEKEERAKKLLYNVRQKYSQMTNEKKEVIEAKNKLVTEVESLKSEIAALKLAATENIQAKSEKDSKVNQLESELRVSKELLQKLNDLHQKLVQRKQTSKPTGVGLADRTSSGSEPLTANIKPLTSPATSASPGLRHSAHPQVNISRPTPTASIRPMAIGQASAATPPQTRMATVTPTSVMPHTEEVAPLPVPQAAVPPTPAVTVAPKTPAATIAPHTVVISEVTLNPIGELDETVPILEGESVQNVLVVPVVSTPVTAHVSPRVEGTDASADSVAVDAPSPTASVIVSPSATQTQVVPPTVKRPREESASEGKDGLSVQKRIRMVSEGSQTNQRPVAATPPTNVAVVTAAQAVSRNNKPELSLSVEVIPSSQVEITETPVLLATAVTQPSTSNVDATIEEITPTPAETLEDEVIEDEEKDVQVIEWEAPDETKIETELEGMDEEIIDINEDLEEDEQMQGIDARSPVDEDMVDDQTDVEDMSDQPTPVSVEIDILDCGSDTQMDSDNTTSSSSGMQVTTTTNAAVAMDQPMAPPTFPPVMASDPPLRSEATAEIATGTPLLGAPQRSPISLQQFAARQERLPSIGRQHLTPFTIPGQGANFEEGDDSIVPSTPTLYVPRRADGFAEAVSSPHVPQQRFLFSSSESSPTQQGLSQLATQGALGVDDTRMDLSQFDEGGGRTVPTTPALQVSPPAEATVPEVSDAVLEQAVSEAVFTMPIPVIKVDLVDDLDVSTSESLPIDNSSKEVKESDTKDDDKTDVTLSGERSVSEEKDKSSSTLTSDIPSKAKDAEAAENQESKDPATTQAAQRKPIVWRKSDTATTPSPQTSTTSDAAAIGTATSSGMTLLPTPASPVRGRGRPRRMRYPSSGSDFGRGAAIRGTAVRGAWSGTGRRGRAAGRRRSMY